MLKKSKKTKNLISQAHVYSKKQETDLASKLSGNKTPGSGSGSVKGDVLVGESVMLEAKCTQNASYSLKLEHLLTYLEQAYGQSRELVLQLDYINKNTNKKIAGFVLVSDTYLPAIVECIERDRGEKF